jgi:hypothetical protein
MARQAEQNPTAGKINKTPPPDEISRPRNPSAAGHGQNNDPNPSSIEPGKRVVSPLGLNLETSVDDGGGALAHIIANGTAMPSPDWQTRAVSAEQKVPTTFGMRNRSGEK